MKTTFLTISIIFLFSCSGSINNNYQAELKNNRWILKYFEGEKLAFNNFEKEVFIQFPIDSENQFRGFAGCNNIFGGYSVNKDSLKFLDFASTRMSCPFNDFESRFLKTLQSTDRYKIEKDIITLFSNNNAILKFQATYYQ